MDINSIKELISNVASVELEEIDESEEFSEMYFWDSLKHTELLLEIEVTMGIKIPIELLVDLDTPLKISEYIVKEKSK